MDRSDLINAILGCPPPDMHGQSSALVEQPTETGGAPLWREDGLCRLRKSELKRLYDGVRVEWPVMHDGSAPRGAEPVNALPPLDLSGLSIERLVSLGIVPRTWKFANNEDGTSPVGMANPYEWFSKRGMVQTWDKTPLAVEQWVTRGATLREIMLASGGSCNPARIAAAIEEWGKRHRGTAST